MVPPMSTGWPKDPSAQGEDREAREGTCELVVHWNEWVVRREGTSAAFSVNQQCLQIPIHHVLLHLGDVVRDIVDHMHV
jgi:hypothetical protein